MSRKGWFNLEAATPANLIPDSQFFEAEPAFASLKLSKTTRLYGFAACFAILYGFGTIISLAGTGFIVGFFKQLELMFKPTRIITSIIFLASVAMIFVGAFVIGSGLLCIILVIVQFLAYIWYTLSYIPYARSAVMGVLGRTV
ncbi:hypothetical protein EW145_g5325 [Phellinidium pouzarii]|uniref:Protein transport protein SFT2 n=1 Tax=Phellinidium pouzarii TaxID=167371 RepID=A0A4S4L0B2_9AGAM|nr:hypothetical protein EW145_g5325 [Phellinidium pouzarii]